MSLKEIRLSKNLTQKALGQLSGIKQNGISRYEAGKRNMSLKAAKALSKALDCSIDDLLRDSEDENKAEIAA